MARHYAPWTDSETWPILRERARRMRSHPTPAERALWAAVRDRKLGVRFRRQHPILAYLGDLSSVEAGVVIEIDGSIHSTQAIEDAIRQEFIEGREFRVIRFSNDEVLNQMSLFTSRIREVLTDGAS